MEIEKLDLKTGDLIMFNSNPNGLFSILSNMIKIGTHSNYTHIGMILKDPSFISPSLKGLYVWESGWEGEPDPQDNKIKLGVQITPLTQMIKNFDDAQITIRKIECNSDTFNNDILNQIHKVVYEKPYDIMPLDWILAIFRKDIKPQKTNRFWCSAFVGYIYTKCGILKENTDWSILRPCDFSVMENYLKFNDNYKLSKNEIKIKN
tara:strand:+ start:1565 stop:2182 length:618 start_codon:yes stop_codon:yes gene_type:complete